MDTIEVLTGQHITIEYQPATIFQRIFATLIDFAVKGIYGIAVFFLFYDGAGWMVQSEESYIKTSLFSIPIFFYHFLFEAFTSGRTPGKMLMKIRVTNVDGSTPGLGAYFLRWILRPVDMVLNWGIGLFLVIFTKNHQRLGDLAAGTTVIKATTQEPVINTDFYDFSNGFQPTYPQAEKLTPGQIGLITDLLELPVPNDEYDEDDSLLRLSQKVQEMLNIHPSGQNERTFLTTIVKDYNYYASLGF
jgi:uncharacterized RDD family membrane protein YckC